MKKNTMKRIEEALSTLPEYAVEYEEVKAENAKNEEKAQANREAYAAAHDVVMAHINDKPQTIADIFAACEDELPDGFSKSKVQYAILNYWVNEVVKHDNGKAPYTYTRV